MNQYQLTKLTNLVGIKLRKDFGSREFRNLKLEELAVKLIKEEEKQRLKKLSLIFFLIRFFNLYKNESDRNRY